LIPAIFNIYVGALPATIPQPLGAGINLILAEPPCPVSFYGTVCGRPILLP